MLSDYRVHPSLATADIKKARRWYAERLGLEPALEYPELLAYRVDATMFTVFETPSARTAENTVAVSSVDDLRAEMARLRARGLVFEDVDLGPVGRTEDGILTETDPQLGVLLSAWFRDADGNWISIAEQRGSEMAALRLRGLVFNEYDLGDLKTVDGVYADPDDGTLNAWFTDSEGNILGLAEDHGPPIRPRERRAAIGADTV